MKTTRRQELRTNDLSQQIEQFLDSLKDNATTITVVVVVVAALSFGGYWYYGQRSSKLEDGYSQLATASPSNDPADNLRRFQAIAREQIDPGLTIAAWSRAGDLALSLLTAPPVPAADATIETPPPPPRDELIPAAEEAFSNVLAQAANDPLARGHAMIAMGVLEEDRGQFEKARQWYEKVLADDRLKDLPFQSEAEFRLAGLKTWSRPANFPPPPPMVLAPPPSQPVTLENLSTSAPASMPANAANDGTAPAPKTSADSPASTADQPRPMPTTQPASSD